MLVGSSVSPYLKRGSIRLLRVEQKLRIGLAFGIRAHAGNTCIRSVAGLGAEVCVAEVVRKNAASCMVCKQKRVISQALKTQIQTNHVVVAFTTVRYLHDCDQE